MARLSTCKGCSLKLQPNEKQTHSGKSYCIDCYKKVTRESEEYKALIDFICINYKLERPTGFILKQIKDYKSENNWSYGAMTYTLWYCKEILEKELHDKYGIALVKHYYDEAANYYIQQEKAIRQMEKLKDVEIKTKIIKRNNNTHEKESLLINLSELLEGGDDK